MSLSKRQYQDQMAKRFVCKNLESQLTFDLNKLNEFKMYSSNAFKSMGIASSEFKRTPNLETSKKSLILNMDKYVPDLTTLGPQNAFLEGLKKYSIQSNIPKNTTIFKNAFMANSNSDIESANMVPQTLASLFGNDIINSSFEGIFNDFSGGEFVLGGMMSIYNHNLKVLDVSGLTNRITSNVQNLAQNFPEMTNLPQLDNIITKFPTDIASLGTNYSGKIDPQGMVSNLSEMISVDDIMNSLDVSKIMNVGLNNIMGQISQLVPGFDMMNNFMPMLSKLSGFGGSCGCGGLTSALGGGLPGALQGAVGQINDAIGGALGGITEGFSDVAGQLSGMADSAMSSVQGMTGQISNISNSAVQSISDKASSIQSNMFSGKSPI